MTAIGRATTMHKSYAREFLTAQLVKLYTRRCRGCDDTSPHSHHLTWLGHRHYVGP